MPSITSLVTKLTADFSQFQFMVSTEFRWAPNEKTVFFKHDSDESAPLLHELAHGLLEHTSYTRDIQLLEMERDAWQYAQTKLCPKYAVKIDDVVVQDALDTYRDWLHARSTCPECHATGVQIQTHTYKCIACGSKWKVNDARICALRRRKV